MGVPVLSKVFLIFFLLGFFGKKEKQDVPRIQRAIVTENQAIIYKKPDFDAEQIMKLPGNKIVAISTKIYRPKNLFGSFYRIFINKPRKIRGYISEIDVLAQYKKSEDGYALNPNYQKKEKALRQVKTDLVPTGAKPSVLQKDLSLQKETKKLKSEDLPQQQTSVQIPQEEPKKESSDPPTEEVLKIKKSNKNNSLKENFKEPSKEKSTK